MRSRYHSRCRTQGSATSQVNGLQPGLPTASSEVHLPGALHDWICTGLHSPGSLETRIQGHYFPVHRMYIDFYQYSEFLEESNRVVVVCPAQA